MKIELIEETEYTRAPMYVIRVEGTAVQWFVHKEDAEKLYESIVTDPSILKTRKIILKSKEIEVSSQENNQTS